VASVLGGAMGNDAIFALSGKGEPSDNLVAFALRDGMVVRERRPAS